MTIAYIVVGVIVVGVIAILISRYYAQKRTEELQAVADSMGLSFSAKADDSFMSAVRHFHLFSQGRSKQALNVMSGSANDIDVAVFDYQYTTGGGKSSHTWKQTVVLLRSEMLALPNFTLRPENLFHKIGGALGYQDIDFDTHPTFSREYLLRSKDEQECRETFTVDVLGYYDQRPGLSTEGDGDSLLFFRGSKIVRPDDVPVFLKEGLRVLGLLQADV